MRQTQADKDELLSELDAEDLACLLARIEELIEKEQDIGKRCNSVTKVTVSNQEVRSVREGAFARLRKLYTIRRELRDMEATALRLGMREGWI